METARIEAYKGLPKLTKLRDDAQFSPKWEHISSLLAQPMICQILIMIIKQITIPVG
jgi:hypothetical protein